MARKTPAKVIEIIKTHSNMRNGINSRAGLSQSEKIAALDAINMMMESILHLHNCYAGFKYVNAAGGPITDDYYRTHSNTGARVLDPVTNASHEYYIRY